MERLSIAWLLFTLGAAPKLTHNRPICIGK